MRVMIFQTMVFIISGFHMGMEIFGGNFAGAMGWAACAIQAIIVFLQSNSISKYKDEIACQRNYIWNLQNGRIVNSKNRKG